MWHFLNIYLDVTDDDMDKYEESQDPQPLRLRLRHIRLGRFRRLRRIRVRIRLRRLKCPFRCAAYYACLAKTAGLRKLACIPLKKHCRCWEKCCFKTWSFPVYVVFKQCKYEFENRSCLLLSTKTIKIWIFTNLTVWKFLSFVLQSKKSCKTSIKSLRRDLFAKYYYIWILLTL